MEKTIVPCLTMNGYATQRRARVGFRPHGGRHEVDVLVTSPSGRKVLVSCKWQQKPGTVEEKVPWDVLCLGELMAQPDHPFASAYVVIGGTGFRTEMKDFYLRGGLNPFVKNAELVHMVTIDAFMSLANDRKL